MSAKLPVLFPAGPSAGISGVRSRRPSTSELASKSASLVSGRMIGACRSHGLGETRVRRADCRVLMSRTAVERPSNRSLRGKIPVLTERRRCCVHAAPVLLSMYSGAVTRLGRLYVFEAVQVDPKPRVRLKISSGLIGASGLSRLLRDGSGACRLWNPLCYEYMIKDASSTRQLRSSSCLRPGKPPPVA